MNAVFPSASQLGFGCASLGSRIGAARGLDALSQAFEHGINWFDLAPSYGDGRAEEIFSRFCAGRRQKIHICTKCGIAPATINGVASRLRPAVRSLVRMLPLARRAVGNFRPAPKRVKLTADHIRSSLDASLKKLKTDYVDVLALHDPDEIDITQGDVGRALEDVLQSGKARAVGIAGTADNSLLALKCGLPVRHLQFADGPSIESAKRVIDIIGAAAGTLSIATHSVFSSLARQPELNSALLPPLRSLLGGDAERISPKEVLLAAALLYALGANRHGVVILSMYSRAHLQFNLQHAARADDVDIDAISSLFRRIVEDAHSPALS